MASVPWAIYLLLVVVWVGSLDAQGAYASRFAGAGTEACASSAPRGSYRAAGVHVVLPPVPFSRAVWPRFLWRAKKGWRRWVL